MVLAIYQLEAVEMNQNLLNHRGEVTNRSYQLLLGFKQVKDEMIVIENDEVVDLQI